MDLENHRTETKYEYHRVTKLVCFELVNNFLSLFYIAFYLQNFELLRNQIRMLLVMHGFAQVAFPLVIESVVYNFSNQDNVMFFELLIST